MRQTPDEERAFPGSNAAGLACRPRRAGSSTASVVAPRTFGSLENGDKYTPDVSRPIRLVAFQIASGVAFEVQDHGVGIPEEDLPRLFTAFCRGEKSRFARDRRRRA